MTIEKLPGMSSASIEDLKEHVTATFQGKLERFGVVSALVTAEETAFALPWKMLVQIKPGDLPNPLGLASTS